MSKTVKTENNKGFTLIEVLVAISIFSIIIFTLFSSFNAFISSSHAVKDQITENEKIRTGLQRICKDLEELVIVQPPRYSKPGMNEDPDPFRFIGKEEAKLGNIFARLEFASLAHAKTRTGDRDGVARIIYYVRSNQDATCDILRSDRLNLDVDGTEPCKDPAVIKNISKFEARFKDIRGETYRYWDSDSDEFKNSTPAVVDITLEVKVKDSLKSIETSVVLPVVRKAVE